jgi:hypothetical protein
LRTSLTSQELAVSQQLLDQPEQLLALHAHELNVRRAPAGQSVIACCPLRGRLKRRKAMLVPVTRYVPGRWSGSDLVRKPGSDPVPGPGESAVGRPVTRAGS